MNAVFSQTKCGKSFDQSQKLLLGVYNLAAISLEFGKHAVLHALCSCLFALKTAYALFAFANMRTQLHEMLKDLRFLEQLEVVDSAALEVATSEAVGEKQSGSEQYL
ncbi:hypothetical protein PF001_g14711 [Phytophthora fragariae]|uniref:Uncharacterized protein n=1 Tax=Phytophthora fragariae TaxID=53985 RepID=A0A6A3JYE3_9STRA|nr:hypothetical protein PF003_g9647 [Phytophthora fragariae]KAE8933442.1 hypothetical protein PF009_g16552 [Phytophthora fragariae]KAE9000286.1 hypothetical protein PF011_g14249 [Phytophthora fragariae]KAE9136949.1 hypothetical protein PF006_g14282 [Phytophthora fragariae]KAE9300899.1 hypothetical protein PF001_g14711 [Phytophthora fragariae]